MPTEGILFSVDMMQMKVYAYIFVNINMNIQLCWGLKSSTSGRENMKVGPWEANCMLVQCADGANQHSKLSWIYELFRFNNTLALHFIGSPGSTFLCQNAFGQSKMRWQILVMSDEISITNCPFKTNWNSAYMLTLLSFLAVCFLLPVAWDKCGQHPILNVL